MTDRQNCDVQDWLKTHSSATVHTLSQHFDLPLEQVRARLLAAVDALGRQQFRLIYCRHDPDSGTFTLQSSSGTMDVESEDMVLFSVQYRSVARQAITLAEKTERNASMEKAVAQGSLVVHEQAGIKPLLREVRELLPHRKRKAPIATDTPAPKPTNGVTKPSVVPRGKPALKAKAQVALAFKAVENPPPSPQTTDASKGQKSESESPPDPPKQSQSRVTFVENSEHEERPLKRRSTPHPNKHVKHSDDITEILKSSLYTVEEDDTEATPVVSLKRKLDETTEPQPRKTAPRTASTVATTPAQAPSEGFKRVKVTKTETFVDETTGYIISKDVVVEEVVKEQTMPLKPMVEAQIAHKKGKQTSIGSFFGRK